MADSERYRVVSRVIDCTVPGRIAAAALEAEINAQARAGYLPAGWRPYDGSCVLEIYERAPAQQPATGSRRGPG